MGLLKYHSCLPWGKTTAFLEGFYRKVLLPQCAAGLNGFQLLAEERRGNKHECCFTVSNRKAPPKPMVSPGKALTWLLSLGLSFVQLWAAPSSTSHGSSARGLAGTAPSAQAQAGESHSLQYFSKSFITALWICLGCALLAVAVTWL